jgi:hypothetical protein
LNGEAWLSTEEKVEIKHVCPAWQTLSNQRRRSCKKRSCESQSVWDDRRKGESQSCGAEKVPPHSTEAGAQKEMKEFHIKTIPHSEQRYPTVGDWFETDPEHAEIRVSDMGNQNAEFLVALHELVEFYLCDKHGVTDEMVTAFDKAHLECDEDSGDLPEAPYRKEHRFATSVERHVCAALGMSWQHYNDLVANVK